MELVKLLRQVSQLGDISSGHLWIILNGHGVSKSGSELSTLISLLKNESLNQAGYG